MRVFGKTLGKTVSSLTSSSFWTIGDPQEQSHPENRSYCVDKLKPTYEFRKSHDSAVQQRRAKTRRQAANMEVSKQFFSEISRTPTSSKHVSVHSRWTSIGCVTATKQVQLSAIRFHPGRNEHYASSMTCKASKSLPSSISRLAPPPVLTCDTLSARPNC
ncbi:hypothetical protein KOR42_31710 [Thalassoglobus neptunius]|uniref:Uncharacterized protein n=1 Tax=Thalassoglobus neptunius TaxID=1938619 RepID=A0A5C5WMN1_9PLAN|nr:hypothetical protein KOR42_31710 [Thalassoglobus neptunius]